MSETSEKVYRIKESTLQGFAEQTRRLACIEEKMCPPDMLQCLEGVVPGTGGGEGENGTAIPNSYGVTFGSENGEFAVREPSYIVNGSDLNKIATITQEMSGKKTLITIPEIIKYLGQVQYLPSCTVDVVFDISLNNFNVNATGLSPNVQKCTATSLLSCVFTTSCVGSLEEV